jgi:hypothetical protein
MSFGQGPPGVVASPKRRSPHECLQKKNKPMNNPLQPRAALALAAAQGENLSCTFRYRFHPFLWRGQGEASGAIERN